MSEISNKIRKEINDVIDAYFNKDISGDSAVFAINMIINKEKPNPEYYKWTYEII